MAFDPIALRVIRIWRDLSRTDLAADIGMSRRQVANYEQGVYTPPGSVVVKIAAALDVPADWLDRPPDSTASDAVHEVVLTSRLRQGLPPYLEDPVALDAIVTLLTGRSTTQRVTA